MKTLLWMSSGSRRLQLLTVLLTVMWAWAFVEERPLPRGTSVFPVSGPYDQSRHAPVHQTARVLEANPQRHDSSHISSSSWAENETD